MNYNLYDTEALREAARRVKAFNTTTAKKAQHGWMIGQLRELLESLQDLEKIAADRLRIETLERRNSDSLDFHEVSVWSLRQALRDAYAQGYKTALANPLETRETRHHDCPFCGEQWRGYCDSDNYPNYCPACGEELNDPASAQ